MNNYIVLDNKRYLTCADAWEPIYSKAGRIRVILSGSVDATWGPAVLTGWRGDILGPVTPLSGDYGSIGDLRASIQKTTELVFYDHYNTGSNVIVTGSLREQSRGPKWDSPSNEFRVEVEIIIVSEL